MQGWQHFIIHQCHSTHTFIVDHVDTCMVSCISPPIMACTYHGNLSSNSGSRSESCGKCPLGTFGNVSGLAECYECPLGTFSNVSGLTECYECPLGTFGNVSGLAECYECPLGTFGNVSGLAECFECPTGWYTVTAVDSMCILHVLFCTSGQFNNQYGQEMCQDCKEGDHHNYYNYIFKMLFFIEYSVHAMSSVCFQSFSYRPI